MLTKKYYVMIANAIKRASDAPGYAERNAFVAHELADEFARDNARFDRARFLKACGVLPESYTCAQCGQRIDDGKPCGCGAR